MYKGDDGRYAMKENHNIQTRFHEMCEVLYLLVHKFHCLRKKLLLKFAPDFERKVDAWCSTCFDLSGEPCSGCENSRHAEVTLNRKRVTKDDVLCDVGRKKDKILDLLKHNAEVTWKGVLARLECTPAIAMWAMLELMLKDLMITITLIVNMKSGVKDKLVLKLV